MLGRVYRIVNPNVSKVYVGATRCSLQDRMNRHTWDFACWKRNPEKRKRNYFTSFKLLETEGECTIELLEEFKFDSIKELHARERHWIENLDVVNVLVPTRTHKEYKQTHRDQTNIHNRTYRERHADTMNKKKVCECGGRYTHKNVSIHLKTKKHVRWLDQERKGDQRPAGAAAGPPRTD